MYLDFLSVLCVCKGASVTKNQDYITDKLLIEKKKEYVLVHMPFVFFRISRYMHMHLIVIVGLS